MATRFYLPSSGDPPVTPAFMAWNKTSQAVRRAMLTIKSGTAMTSSGNITLQAGTSPNFILIYQFVSAPLAAQTISGNVSGVIIAKQNSDLNDATLALGIKVVTNDGQTLRGTLLGITADDSLVSELTSGTPSQRQFRNSTEQTAIPLSEVVVQSGDRLVVEIGFRELRDSTTSYVTAYTGDNAASDLTQSDSGTVQNNPWIEFSQTLSFSSFTEIGEASTAIGDDAGQVWNYSIFSGAPSTISAKTFNVIGVLTPVPDPTGAGIMIALRPAGGAVPLTINLAGAGIPSEEAVGEPTIWAVPSPVHIIIPSSITSAEAFGSPTIIMEFTTGWMNAGTIKFRITLGLQLGS